MVLTVSPTLSVIVSIWMETLFYGINVMVYFLCIYDLLFVRKYASKSTKRILVSLSTLLFLVATAHVGVNCRRLIEGYVNPPDKISSVKYLLDITQPTNVAKQFLVVMANLFSDILIIWRIYMVWEGSWLICVLPSLLCIGVFTCGIAAAVFVSRVAAGQSIFFAQISIWGKAQFSLSLAMNVSATLLIAARIWWITRPIRTHDPNRMRPYWRLIVIVIESAAFAAFAQTIELAFYASAFPGVYFVADSVVQIVSMNPLLIIAFIGRTRRNQEHTWEPTYVSPGRVLTEPSYAPRSNAAITDTELSMSIPHEKAVRLSLAEKDSDGDLTANTYSMTSEKEEKRRMESGNDSKNNSAV